MAIIGMGKKASVEVQIDGAWMEAVVVVAYGRGRGRRYKVRYDLYPDDDAQPLTEEDDVPFERVRPIPPHTPHNYNYSIRDAVEVSDKGCWWQGIITQVMLTNSEFFLICIPHNDIHKMYHRSKLRPAQEWLKGKWSPVPSQQTSNIKYEGKYPIAANSGITSIASSPWDMQTNAQSQRKFDKEEVKKQRRHCDRIENRATLDVEECSVQAIRNRDSRRPKTFNHGNAILNNTNHGKTFNHGNAISQKERNIVEQNQERNPLAHSKGVKRVYVHDCRKDRTYGGIQDAPGNDVKRFKHTELTKAMDQIQMGILKYIETSAESCTGSAILCSSRTKLDNQIQRNNLLNVVAGQSLETHDRDNQTQRNNPLNVVAGQSLETHDRELFAYHYVLEAFYAQTQDHLTWERHDILTSLRLALHITTDEHIDKLKRLISQS